jgi:Uncharacterized conserved protein
MSEPTLPLSRNAALNAAAKSALMLGWACCLQLAHAAPSGGDWITPLPSPYGAVLEQQALPPPHRDYQMSRVLTPAERRRWLELAMPTLRDTTRLDAREALNHFAIKYQARPGLSFDEVVDALKLRANRLNLKQVGSNLLSRDFNAVLGDSSAPRVEVFSFCDIATARELLKAIPEMVVFLPCRIAVMQDADKKIWVLTLDWDIAWLDEAGAQSGLSPQLRASAREVRNKLDEVMRAGANGDL